MAQIKISALTTGTPKGTDLTPATDTTDTTQAASGTTKKYVRSAELNFYLHAQGLTTYTSALVATTAALTATYVNGVLGVGATLTNSGAQSALTIDGVLQVVGNRVLVKNQAVPAQNGIYTVTTVGTGATNWVLTRATDYDQAAEVIQYGVVLVDQGTVSAGLLYQQTGAGPFTMGTTAITFALYTTQSLALPVSLAQGGTQAALTASNGGIFYSNATTGAILSGTATANQLLLSGASAAPVWSTATYPPTTTINQILYSSSANTVAGLATANRAVLTTSATGVPVLTALAADGQLIIGSTAGAPAAATLTAGANIGISVGSNSITISSQGGSGYVWTEVTGASQAMAVDNAYIANNAGVVTLTLPAVAAVGDSVIVQGKGAGGWLIEQNASGQIHLGSSATTAGVGGSLASTNQWDSIELVCVTANNIWAAVGAPQGIITVV